MACPVTCQRRSASTIMSGMAIPMTANTMWKARDTPICERAARRSDMEDRKSTRLNSSHGYISYAVFCLKKKKDYLQRSFRHHTDHAMHTHHKQRLARDH